MGSGRDAALEALTACRRLDAWSDGSMKAACRGLDRREAALCARLAYGVLQNRALLDFYLGAYCGFAKLEPFIRDVLRLGAYQILYMDRVPDSAAVNEAVETVKRKKRQRAAGLVNAVLRRLSREKESLPPLPAGDPADHLALRYSHPRWLVERLLDLLGGEEAEAFLRLDNESVPTALQRNPLRCTARELTDRLAESGGRVQPHPWLPDCWLLSGGGELETMPAFQEGLFQVQDAAAREDADEAVKTQLNDNIQTMADYTVTEAQIENLVVAKGYTDCVAFIGEDALSLAVSAPEGGLTEADTAKILDVVKQTAGYTADQVTIIEVE